MEKDIFYTNITWLVISGLTVIVCLMGIYKTPYKKPNPRVPTWVVSNNQRRKAFIRFLIYSLIAICVELTLFKTEYVFPIVIILYIAGLAYQGINNMNLWSEAYASQRHASELRELEKIKAEIKKESRT